MLSAAKEETFYAFGPWCVQTCISAHESEGEKLHQGVASKKSALHPGITWSNSTTALGLRGARLETRVRSRCTGKEHDPETNNDYFGARYYSSTMGRFLTPDWAATPIPIPYAAMGNPQTLNLYSYVENNPITGTDPDGHCCDEAISFGQQLEASPNPYVEAIGGGIVLGATVGAAIASLPLSLDNVQFSPGASRFGMTGADGDLQAAHKESQPAQEQKSKDDGAKDGDKTVPNPDGKKGAPDHQQTAEEERKDIGPDGQKEVRVATPGGEKEHRFIDAARVENGKVTEARQVIRPNKNGTPPAREVRAANDIQKATGVKPKLVPVRPVTKPENQ